MSTKETDSPHACTESPNEIQWDAMMYKCVDNRIEWWYYVLMLIRDEVKRWETSVWPAEQSTQSAEWYWVTMLEQMRCPWVPRGWHGGRRSVSGRETLSQNSTTFRCDIKLTIVPEWLSQLHTNAHIARRVHGGTTIVVSLSPCTYKASFKL